MRRRRRSSGWAGSSGERLAPRGDRLVRAGRGEELAAAAPECRAIGAARIPGRCAQQRCGFFVATEPERAGQRAVAQRQVVGRQRRCVRPVVTGAIVPAELLFEFGEFDAQCDAVAFGMSEIRLEHGDQCGRLAA